MAKRYRARRPLTTVREITVFDVKTIFLRDNKLPGETDRDAEIRLHKELSILLSKKHVRPLNAEEMTRFKILTEGLGRA